MPKTGVTDPTTLPGMLLRWAEQTPDAVWLEHVDGSTLTYAGTVQEAGRWAAALRSQGVAPGDVVVSMRLNSFGYLTSWLGLAEIGAVHAPVNTDYRADLLVHVLSTTRASTAVVAQSFLTRFTEVADRVPDLRTVVVVDRTDEPLPDLPWTTLTDDQLLAGVEPVPLRVPAPWETACVMHTSGTTGPSKGVVMPWAQLHAWTLTWDPGLELGPDDVVHCPGPTYHIGGKMFPALAALAGGRALVRPYIHATSTSEDMEKVSFMVWLLPHAIDEWLARPASPTDRDVKLRFMTASPSPRAAEFQERFGVRSLTIFNMTETGCPITDPGWDTGHRSADGRPSCGRLREGYPYYEVRVVDEHDQPVAPGEVGELVVRSAVPWTMNAGYLNMPEATAEAWRNGWFHTGDALVQDHEGWFYFQDRIKDAIRRRGENISSWEVEAVVVQHPDVVECAAVAARVDGDEEVKVCVVRTPGSTLTERELVEFLIPRMPRFMVPRFVELVDALPKTPTHKVRKVELREQGVTERTWDRVAHDVVVPR